MTRFSQVEKLSAKNALDYQTRLLEVSKKIWQEKWASAVNPFVAWNEWRTGKSIRDVVYAPWQLAKNQSELCGSPNK